MNVQKLIHSIFKDSKKTGLIHHEVIKRSVDYRQKLQDWIQSSDFSEVLKLVSKSYSYEQLNLGESELKMRILDTACSNGFLIQFDTSIFSIKSFKMFFDYLAERVQEQGYKLANSDIKIQDRNDQIESVEKHYLKPKVNQFQAPIDQKYGNVLIEHVSINDQPTHLKLMANSYSGHSYRKPYPFKNLANKLFESVN